MRITKLEALALAKGLHSLGLACHPHLGDTTVDTLVGLAKKVDIYLLCGSEDEELAKDDTPKKMYKVPLKGRAEEEDEGEPEEDEDPDSFVSGPDLHDLKPVQAKGGTLEFELRQANGRTPAKVDLLHDGVCVVEDVSDLRRSGKEIRARSHDEPDEWSTFAVTKFSKDWTKALPLEELVGVEA